MAKNRRQKVPKSDFQSRFSTSKILRIFLKKFSLKNINLGATFLFLSILCSIKIERLLFLKFLKNLAFFDSYFWPFNKTHEKIIAIFVISAIMASIWNVFIKFCWHDEKLTGLQVACGVMTIVWSRPWTTDTQRERFFKNLKLLGLGRQNGRTFLRHLGYFRPNYFGTVCPLSMGKCIWFIFLQKTLVFRSKTYNYLMLPK